MNPIEKGLALLTLLGAAGGIAKVIYEAARFFAGLAANLRALTDAVRALTKRLDDHANDFGTLRERVAALESWREDAA